MTRTRTLATAAAVAALAAAIAPAMQAYSSYGKWGTVNVSFYVNPANGDVSHSAAISALQAAMAVWNTQSGTPFRFSYAGQVNDTTTGYDRKNVILFRNEDHGSAIASTYSWASNGVLVDSDITYWDDVKFFTGSSGCSSGAYIEDIGAHELGHAMGLSHSSFSGATMNGSYSTCSQTQRTLTSDDIAGAQHLYGGGGATDTPPTATIAAPTSGTNVPVGTAVGFSGSASDTPDGNLSSYLSWRSNLDGQIGLGASFSRALTAGSHTITATVTDSTGHTTSVTTLVTVSSSNSAPTVSIASPANNATVTAGTSVTFSGSSNDTQDGNLTSGLVWRSNIDGQIGTGGTFTKALTVGTHTITASVVDSGGLTGQRSITVSAVSSSSPSGGPKLTARGYREKGNQKADLTWSGLTTASVDVYRNNVKVSTTANDGAMTDAIDKKGNGSYNYKVCGAGGSTCSNQENVSF